MPLNWHRGFNRLFVLAAFAWAISVLIYVFSIYPDRQKIAALDRESSQQDACDKHRDEELKGLESLPIERFAKASEPVYRQWSACYDSALRLADREYAAYLPRIVFATWGARFALLAIVVAPPSIAYAVFLAIAWAVRGFRTPCP